MQEHDNDFIEDSKVTYDIEGTKDTTEITALGRALSSPTIMHSRESLTKSKFLLKSAPSRPDSTTTSRAILPSH